MAAYMGILATARDKDTSVPEKLKLVKFAWAKPEVPIPNKYQEILDFVCGLIVNRKKNGLKEEDVKLVWKALLEFLKASKSSFNVKVSICKAVTEYVHKYVEKTSDGEKQDKNVLSVVLDCGSLLLAIPSVQLSLSFSDLNQQLSTLLRFCLKDSDNLGKAQDLVKTVVSVLTQQLVMCHDHKEVITSISGLMPMFVKYQSSHPDPQLQQFVLSCLFIRTFKEAHKTCLKARSNDFNPRAQFDDYAKSLKKIYSAVFDEPTDYVVSTFLPAFVAEFLKQNVSDSALCFCILKYVLQLLRARGADHQDLTLLCLEKCLRASKSVCDSGGNDIFVNKAGEDFTNWLQRAVESFLPNHKDGSWCEFMSCVLALRPLVIDRYLARVLTAAMTKVDSENKACESDRDAFLSELITIFLKLRRIPYLHQCLVQVISSGLLTPVTSSSLQKFKEKLHVMFHEVPIASLMSMWEDIKNKLELTLTTENSTGKTIKQSWFLFLLNSLLSHTQFFDQRSMGMVEEKIHTLLESTESNVLKPLAKEHGSSSGEMPILVDVMATWAYVKMLLYPKWREQAGVGIHTDGVEDAKVTKKLIKKVPLPTKVRLILQRRQVLTSGSESRGNNFGKSHQEVIELLEGLLESLTKQLEEGNDQESFVLFQEFTEIFPLVGHCLSDELIEKWAHFIVDAVRNGAKGSFTLSGDGSGSFTGTTTLYAAFERFLHHPATMEHRWLQTCLASLIWSKLLKPKTGGSPKKKKKKMASSEEPGNESVSKMYQFITDAKMDCADFVVNPDDIAHTLMVVGPINPDLIQLLMCLALEFLPLLSLKSQLGFMSVAACLPSVDGDNKDEITSLVEKSLVQCLSGRELTQLFTCISPDKFLGFSLSLCSQPFSMSRRYLECSMTSVMNKHNQSAILSIAPVVKQLAKDMRSDSDADVKSNETKILAASSLIHTYSQFKIFKVKGAAVAAKEIFCTLSKAILKNVPGWLSSCQYGTQNGVGLANSGSSSAKKKKNSKPLQKAGKKRKLQEEEDDGVIEAEVLGKNAIPKSARAADDALCVVLKCVTEILMAWPRDSGEDKMNRHLTAAVSVVHEKLKERENACTGLVSQQIKPLQLHFIKAVCECQKKLMAETPTSSSFSTETPSKTTTPSKSRTVPSNLFPLFDDEGILDFWQNIFTLATSELSALTSSSDQESQLSKTNDDKNDVLPPPTITTARRKIRRGGVDARQQKNSQTKSSITESHDSNYENGDSNNNKDCDSERKSGQGSAGGGFVLEDMKSWPQDVYLCVDILVQVAEIGGMKDRRNAQEDGSREEDKVLPRLWGVMMEHLKSMPKPDLVSVITSLAVWRRLTASPFVINHLATEMAEQLYQVLTHSSSLLQHLNFQRKALIPSSWSSSSTQAAMTTGTKPSPSHQGENDLSASLCRFIVCSLTRFVRFAKDANQGHLPVLCLQVAPALSLVCPADIRALHQFVNAFLFYHPPAAMAAISAVVVLVSKLVCACVRLGYQSKLSEKGPEVLEDLVDCSKLVSRAVVCLTEGVLKDEVHKIGHTLLADYVMELQKGALHPRVKKELVVGLYQLLSVCGIMYLNALNAALPSEVRETFKFMHKEFEKFYKYKRNV